MDKYYIDKGSIALYKYKVIKNSPEYKVIDRTNTLDEANYSKSKFEELGMSDISIEEDDISDIQWLENIRVNTIEEAQDIYEKGQEKYLANDTMLQMQLALAELAELLDRSDK